MDEAELQERLTALARSKTGDGQAEVTAVQAMPGHAGFSWGFTLTHRGGTERLVLRLPPPGVRWVGTADIVRQARVMQALAGSAVPVPAVRWTGDELEWFERPYYVVEQLPGVTLWFRTPDGEPIAYDAGDLQSRAEQVTRALADLHALDWREVMPAWDAPLSLEEEVIRWDWLHSRTADPELTALAPAVRERLLSGVPSVGRQGIVHGDYQWTNHLFHEGRLQAVLDWELATAGDVRMDAGWLLTFSDRKNWTGFGSWEAPLPSPEVIIAMYERASGHTVADLPWFRALAGYKFALITGLNLSLHRKGRRVDPHWEMLAPSAPLLLARAQELLGSG